MAHLYNHTYSPIYYRNSYDGVGGGKRGRLKLPKGASKRCWGLPVRASRTPGNPICGDRPQCSVQEWINDKTGRTNHLCRNKNAKPYVKRSRSPKSPASRATIDKSPISKATTDKLTAKTSTGKSPQPPAKINPLLEGKDGDSFFSQRCNNIQNIYGPKSICYFKCIINNVEKKILLLGDHHTPLETLIPINDNKSIYYDEFIMDILVRCSNEKKCVDFYQEIQLTKKQGDPFSGGMYKSIIDKYQYDTLNYMRNIFTDCYTKEYTNTSEQKCTVGNHTIDPDGSLVILNNGESGVDLHNLRLHSTDLRLSEGFDLLDQVKITFGSLNIILDDVLYDELLKYILSINPYKTHKNILSMCPPNVDRTQFNDFIKMINKSKVKIETELQKFKKYKTINANIHEFIYNYYSNKKKMVAMVSGAIVDIYTMLRMLKNFKTHTNRGPMSCRQANSQNKIIAYAGSVHIDCYKYVLENILCEPIYTQKNLASSKKILNFNPNSYFTKNFNEIMIDFCK